jgi:pimeloyl-ACP methyl ester carboxylesterase
MRTQKMNVISIGKGIPVVLLHSAMSSKLQWFKLMHSMSSDYLMIAVDFYGYGDSPFPSHTESFSLSDEITLIESLLDGIIPPGEPFHLVGHSYGGAVGLCFCYKAEERIRSLTLFEPVAYHLLPETEAVLANVHQLQAVVNNYIKEKKYAAAAEHFLDYWNGAGTFSNYPKEVQDLLSKSAKKLPLGFQALMEEPLSLEDYSKIKRPVCLIAGRQSPLASRRVSELLVDYLTDCHFHWVSGGHMAPILQTDEVNAIIEPFIRQIK